VGVGALAEALLWLGLALTWLATALYARDGLALVRGSTSTPG
jgi:hypothetical protein